MGIDEMADKRNDKGVWKSGRLKRLKSLFSVSGSVGFTGFVVNIDFKPL